MIDIIYTDITNQNNNHLAVCITIYMFMLLLSKSSELI